MTVRLHGDVSTLNIGAGSLTEGVGHDDVDGRLRSECSSIGEFLLRQLHTGVSLLLGLQLEVELLAGLAIGLQRKIHSR